MVFTDRMLWVAYLLVVLLILGLGGWVSWSLHFRAVGQRMDQKPRSFAGCIEHHPEETCDCWVYQRCDGVE